MKELTTGIQFTFTLSLLFTLNNYVQSVPQPLSGNDLFGLDHIVDTMLGDTLHQHKDNAVTCKDADREAKLCQGWKEIGACETNRRGMRRYCAKTCDLCTPPAPPLPVLPACAKTTFGCCWDNTTAAQGPVVDGLTDLHDTQCRPCMDRQSPEFCNRFSDKCHSLRQGQGDVMRNKCPGTCGTPCGYNLNINKQVCEDDEAHRQACLEWFIEGKCETNQGTMRVLCPYSCGFCH